MHFLIAHGPAVVEKFGGYVGELTEESQERTNKDLRSARLFHARKNGRVNNLVDIVHWLMQRSDPSLY